MIQTDYARTLQGYSNKQHLMLRNAMRPNNNYLTGWLVGYMPVATVAWRCCNVEFCRRETQRLVCRLRQSLKNVPEGKDVLGK